MAYTTYPSEAANFSAKTTEINTQLTKTRDDLKKIKNIFKIDKNEDYLTIKTLEANEKIIQIIESGLGVLNVELGLVKKTAQELEEKAIKEAEALEAKKMKEAQEENGGAK